MFLSFFFGDSMAFKHPSKFNRCLCQISQANRLAGSPNHVGFEHHKAPESTTKQPENDTETGDIMCVQGLFQCFWVGVCHQQITKNNDQLIRNYQPTKQPTATNQPINQTCRSKNLLTCWFSSNPQTFPPKKIATQSPADNLRGGYQDFLVLFAHHNMYFNMRCAFFQRPGIS